MKFQISLTEGTVKQYKFKTFLTSFKKISVIVLSAILCLFLLYKLMPNPYLCYGYYPVKIGRDPIEFDWIETSYQCRFGIANSGILSIRNPVLQLYFIDGATVTLTLQNNKEWQENDSANYFWTKNIIINGGIHKSDYAERAWPINIKFHKKGINRVKYIITSNGIQKIGEIKVINRY